MAAVVALPMGLKLSTVQATVDALLRAQPGAGHAPKVPVASLPAELKPVVAALFPDDVDVDGGKLALSLRTLVAGAVASDKHAGPGAHDGVLDASEQSAAVNKQPALKPLFALLAARADDADRRAMKEIWVSAAKPNAHGDRLPSNWLERLDDGRVHAGVRQSHEGGLLRWCVSVDAVLSKDPDVKAAAISLLGVVRQMQDLFVVTVDPRLLADPRLHQQLDDACALVGGLATTPR